MTKHYKNEQIMKILTILGALFGLAYIISGFASLVGLGFLPGFLPSISPLADVFNLIIGLVVVALTFLVAMKPDNPLPFHWLVLFILGILLVIFGAEILACVLLIIAALIGLIEDL